MSLNGEGCHFNLNNWHEDLTTCFGGWIVMYMNPRQNYDP